MRNSVLPCIKTGVSTEPRETLPLVDFESYTDEWLLNGEIAEHSPQTLANRRLYVEKLLWFLKREGVQTVGQPELMRFFAYLRKGHEDPQGRWGNPQEKTPVKPSTSATYQRHIRTLFGYIVTQGGLTASPMERVPRPVSRPSDVQPFTDQQIHALLAAAKETQQGRRDYAMVLFLLETGVRVSELVGLRMRDIDLKAQMATVLGKGNKTRSVYFGKNTALALRDYLRRSERGEDDALFLSERGEALTRSGVQQLMGRLGKSAGLSGARCSPHTWRHTSATLFLREGGNQFALMRLFGHTDVRMTNRYVTMAQADVERQHRENSPVDGLMGGKKQK